MRAARFLLPLLVAGHAHAQSAPRLVVVDPARGAHPDAAVVTATLDEAADWVNAHATAGPTTVRLLPGRHELRTGARFAKTAQLRIEGTPGQTVLSGGLLLPHPAWQPCGDALDARLPAASKPHVRRLELPPGDYAGPVHSGHGVPVQPGPSEVFVGGTALTPARWPDTGYAPIATVLDPGSVPRDAADDVPVAQRKHEAPRGAVFTIADRERLQRWRHATTLWANGFWNWDWANEQLPVARIDPDAGSLTLAAPHTYGVAQRGKFFVLDLPEELDAPGECWLDRQSRVVYAWLRDGQEPAPVEVSMLDAPLLTLADCHTTTVTGITFATTRGEAFTARGQDGFELSDCTFTRTGTRGVGIDGQDASVRRCSFTDVGGCGIDLAGGDRKTLTPSGSSIEDCTFVRCGRVLRAYQPAIRLAGVGHRVAHNELAFHPHIALWFDGNDHRIEANWIHDVVLDTGDAGAVYCGRDWTSHGTVIAGNVFADIPGTDARYQNGVYLDDMASGITVEHNLFVRCNWGMLVGGGRDLTLRDNVFAACGKAMYFDARGVGWMHKELTDPETSTLRRRLAAMPIGEEPWRSRFPTLKDYLTDRFGRPVNGVVAGTVLLGTPFGKIDDPECVRESGTATAKVDAAGLAPDCERWLRSVRRERVTIGEIGVGPVGPRTR